MEILFEPAATEQEHLEKLLRLDELASLLDGYTDGYFTKRMEQLYQERPDLRKLWEFRESETHE